MYGPRSGVTAFFRVSELAGNLQKKLKITAIRSHREALINWKGDSYVV
jgi:hypothetical protein